MPLQQNGLVLTDEEYNILKNLDTNGFFCLQRDNFAVIARKSGKFEYVMQWKEEGKFQFETVYRTQLGILEAINSLYPVNPYNPFTGWYWL